MAGFKNNAWEGEAIRGASSLFIGASRNCVRSGNSVKSREVVVVSSSPSAGLGHRFSVNARIPRGVHWQCLRAKEAVGMNTFREIYNGVSNEFVESANRCFEYAECSTPVEYRLELLDFVFTLDENVGETFANNFLYTL